MKTRELKVSDLMSTALITVTPDESVTAADVEMKRVGIRHLLVVDRQHLVGILSDRDLLAALATRESETIRVRDVMTTPVRTLFTEAPAQLAAQWMVEDKIGALPVEGEDGQLVGVITETDLLKLLVSVSDAMDEFDVAEEAEFEAI